MQGMQMIITVVHVLVALSLIFVVLLQKSTGSDMGAAFGGGGGGGSQSLFGARGSGSFMGKLTAGLATVFMLTSLTLAFISTGGGKTGSIMEGAPVRQEAPAATEGDKGIPVPGKAGEEKAADDGMPVVPKSGE